MNRFAATGTWILACFLLPTTAVLAADPPAKAPATTAAADKAPRKIAPESASQANMRHTMRSKLDIPKGEAPPAAGTMNIPALQTMLENMGYEPKLGEYVSGNKYVTVSIPRGGWTFGMTLDMSSDASTIWINSYLAEVKEPEKVTASAVLKVLEAESSLWPSYLTYYTQAKMVYMYRPLLTANLKPAGLRQTLESFMNDIQNSAAVWDTSKWTAADAVAPPAK